MSQSCENRSTTEDAAVEMLPQTTADLNVHSKPPPAQWGMVEIPASSCNTSGGTDLGYATQVPTTERSTSESCQRAFLLAGTFCSGGLFPRKVTSLKSLDKEIPEAAQSRFYDLRELFDQPLYRYLTLTKPEAHIDSISIKLMVLGEGEASAKPCVVVLCDAAISKSVHKYFNQRLVREEFQCYDADTDLPPLQVVVCERPPRRMGANDSVEIYHGSWSGESCSTLCGTIIQVRSPDKTRIGRIGGVVKVTSLKGSPMLYALTAGHIIGKEQAEDDKPDAHSLGSENKSESGNESEEEEELFSSGDEDFVIDLAVEKVRGAEEHTAISWSNIGHCYISSHDKQGGDQPDLDWALIEFNDPLLYRPNLIPISQIDLIEAGRVPKALSPHVAKVRIVVFDGRGRLKLGTLSKSPSFLLLAPGKKLIDTYTIVMDNGSDSSYGDSGSWAVADASGEVYGHVVASDVFGEAYVVPIDATLADIKNKLAAEHVALPTRTEVVEFRLGIKDQRVLNLALNALQRPTASTAPALVHLPSIANDPLPDTLQATMEQPVLKRRRVYHLPSDDFSDSGYSTKRQSPV